MEIYETEEWEKEDAEFERLAIQSGGGGSNMAEPLYFEPGPPGIPEGLPPEEAERRKKAAEGIREMLERAIAHSEAAKH
jgi:hypothetical protein